MGHSVVFFRCRPSGGTRGVCLPRRYLKTPKNPAHVPCSVVPDASVGVSSLPRERATPSTASLGFRLCIAVLFPGSLSGEARLYLKPTRAGPRGSPNWPTDCHLVVEHLPQALRPEDLAADYPIPTRCYHTQAITPGASSPFGGSAVVWGLRDSPQFDSLAYY